MNKPRIFSKISKRVNQSIFFISMIPDETDMDIGLMKQAWILFLFLHIEAVNT